MKLKIFYDKSISENASYYFDKSKKARKKQEGVLKIIETMKKKLDRIRKKEGKENKEKKSEEVKGYEAGNEREGVEGGKTYETLSKTKKSWFTRFRWFFTSNNILAVGGRDSVTNEILIKKHVEGKDLIFHTDAPGSPFFLLKLGKEYNIRDKEDIKGINPDIEEVAQATACYSKAWALGIGYADAYYVKPEQVSKKAKSGEYLSKGSFMIYGKRNSLRVKLELGVTRIDNKVLVGPLSLIENKAKKYVVLTPGSLKKSDAVKKILFILFGARTKKVDKRTGKRIIRKMNRENGKRGRGNEKKSIGIDNVLIKEIHDTLISQLPSGGFSIEKVF